MLKRGCAVFQRSEFFHELADVCLNEPNEAFEDVGLESFGKVSSSLLPFFV